MPRWKGSPQALAVLIGIAMGLALSPSLSGCSAESLKISQVFESVSGYALSGDAARELDRFGAVYRNNVSDPGNTKQLRHFRNAFQRVRADYVRKVSDAKLIDAAIKGARKAIEEDKQGKLLKPAVLVEASLDSMMGSLDPHTVYYNADEYNDMQVSTRGEFGGLGINVSMEDGLVKVIAPIEDTPAFRAGIKSGDLITHLDGKPIKGRTLAWAVKRMRGLPGQPIRLTIRRDKVDPFDVTIIRDVITVRSVRWRTVGSIGYIRVSRFSEKTEGGFNEAVRAIKKKLGTKLKGVVLDLRDNGGGLLNQSVILADAFLDKGRIVSVKGRNKEDVRVYTAGYGDAAEGLPMVVLINGGSASASEIVASALKENGRAVVMGRRSFGKGSVQTIIPLPIEGALKLTTQLYYGPNDKTIQAFGIEPDIRLTLPEDKDKDGKKIKRRREIDMPGFLPGEAKHARFRQTVIKERDCPAVEVTVIDRKVEDYGLGCATEFLNAGSTAKFIASLGAGKTM